MLANKSSGLFVRNMAQHLPRNEGALEQVAHRFAVLAAPMRLRLIQELFAGERPVNALAEATGGTQANVSRHLQTLARAHVLSRRQAGPQVFYALADPSIVRMCDLVCGSLEKALAERARGFGR